MGQSRARIEEIRRIARLEKAIKQEVESVLPAVYSCLAKVLYEKHNFTPDMIADLFAETQQAWNESVDREETMIDWCESLTGLSLRSGL